MTICQRQTRLKVVSRSDFTAVHHDLTVDAICVYIHDQFLMIILHDSLHLENEQPHLDSA